MKKGGGNKRSRSQNVNASDDGLYDVEAIRDKRMHKGVVQYLVKWEGWPESANTWEPLENLRYIPQIIDAFEESLNSEKSGWRRRKYVSHYTQQPPNESSASVERSNEEADPKLSELKETTNNALDDAIQQEEVALTSNPITVPRNNDNNIAKILRPTHYVPPNNNFKDALINFLVLRSDGTEDTVTNQYLKENYPLLLINYYAGVIRSQHI